MFGGSPIMYLVKIIKNMFNFLRKKKKLKCSKCKKDFVKSDLKMIKGKEKFCCKFCCPHTKDNGKIHKSKNVCEFC